MAADVAQYLHATLYRFNEQARAEVVTRFRKAIGDDETNISYSSITDVFFLQCHSQQGAAADFELNRIINDYISEEIKTAEKEDRLPHIVRFPESNFDDLAVVDEGKERPAKSRHARQPRSSVPRTQIVIAPENEAKVVKLFPLHELQAHGLLERCLAPLTKKSETLLNTGLVCRAARWCPQDGHIFNGRTGGRSSVLVAEQTLELPPFGVIYDRREGVKRLEPPTTNREENTTVKQWLEGIGETRLGPLEANVDIPKDAKQHLASAQTHTAGRARVVKGLGIVPDDQNCDTSEESSESESDNEEFAAILQPPSTQSMAPFKETSLRQTPKTGNSKKHPSSLPVSAVGTGDGRLFQDTKKGNIIGDVPSCGTSALHETSMPVPERSILNHEGRSTAPSTRAVKLRTSQEAQNSEQEWATDKTHAKVDPIGLLSNPANTARWRNENYVALDRKSKAKESRLKPRGKQRVDSSSIAETRPHLRDTDPSHSVDPRGDTGTGSDLTSSAAKGQVNRDAEGAAVPWSMSVAHTWQKTGRLIDPGTPEPGLQSVKVPPGLKGGPETHQEQHKEASTGVNTTGILVELGEVADQDRAKQNPVQTAPQLLSGSRPPLQQGPGDLDASQVGSARADQGEDTIVESIQRLPKNYAKRHNTMRQKAGKNVKGKKGKKLAADQKCKAQLELPDPVPAPKRKQHLPGVAKAAVRETVIGTNNAQTPSDNTTQPARLKPSTRITKDNHAFGKLLQSEKQKQEAHDDDNDASPHPPKLIARLGLLLLRLDERNQEIDRSATDPISMQTNLREINPRTHFLPRLTTCSVDAARLIDSVLVVGDAAVSRSSSSRLELIIRETATGQLLKLTLSAGEQSAEPTQYSIKANEHIRLGEASCHLVAHVWDTQVSLVQPAPDYAFPSPDAINDFIASMATDETPPSFRAQTSNGVFTLEKVLAKRIIEIKKPGMSFQLCEVQDLVTEYQDLGSYNFRALARSREEMIEEQRYWFEAQWETTDLSRADDLQLHVNETIQQMDNIGLQNQGLYVVSQDNRSDDESDVVEQPFW
ncbi:hypothetical protein CKM354_000348400 [Cercospora kikuchii]|uniref:Uncharacterized protein n=1 Tax=Cercospora kikuchii TaxID=84275 RepID=A0A9P3CEX5_9PEZI|nr:uncharacterized protein CKM354_000348400 [Cercospora kikuchii]GIZ40132.1 hypothetical protein CKM354_000348400 [Cercospora kikuchii]